MLRNTFFRSPKQEPRTKTAPLHLDSGATALDVLDDRIVEVAASSEGGAGLPLGGGTGGGLLQHPVDLLKGQTLGLRDKEVGIDEGAGAQAAPDEEDGGLQVTLILSDHVRGNDGNDGVPQPVGGGGQTNTTGSDRQREDLANDNPGTRTPGGSEPEDGDSDEGNLGVDSRNVVGNALGRVLGVGVGLVEADSDTDSGNDELTNKHTESTKDENGTTTEALDGPEGQRGRQNVNQSEDHGDKERVVDSASGLEERGRVVEDEVDTGPVDFKLEGWLFLARSVDTYHCCIICREVPRMVRRKLDF